jgi:hypothetical protein
MKEQDNDIKNHYQRNKDIYLKAAKKWYENNKEKHTIYDKQYREDNKEKRKEYDRTRNDYRRKYSNEKRGKDLNYKLCHYLRSRFNKVLKKNKTNKNNSIMYLLGCTLDEYKKHIEKQWVLDWDWNNYGKIWEIDHIKPCSKFDLTKEEEQKLCFHYSNLQPLSITDNRKKYNKYE